MKIRVTKEERLSKAVNRANLVLVEVPVNTKYGQHRSHRWKKAGEALNQLMKDLGRKGSSADIEFVDKKTKKKIDKKELLENYNKVGRVKGQTIQAYVAENYKVTSGGKAGGKTNDYNGPDDKKDPLSMDNQKITMYSKNEYKTNTYTGTGQCGHEVSVDIGGYSEEYRQDKANEEIGKRMCPGCYKKMIEEKRQEAEREAKALDLPDLQGSERQKDWALTLRSQAIKDLRPIMDKAKEIWKEDKRNIVAKTFLDVARDFIRETDSSVWIDYRNTDIVDRVIRSIKGIETVNQAERFRKEGKEYYIGREEDLISLGDETLDRKRRRVIEKYNDLVKSYMEELREDVHEDADALAQRTDTLTKMEAISDIIKYKRDRYIWATVLENESLEGIMSVFKYGGVLVKDNIRDKITEEDRYKAYSIRSKMARSLRFAKKKGTLRKEEVTKDEIEAAERILSIESGYNFYLSLENMTPAERLKACVAQKEEYDRLAEDFMNDGKSIDMRFLKRFGTKKIEAKGEFEKAESFKDLKSKLSNLKEQHTDVLARATMDMAGINAPLYVKRNGNHIKIGRRSLGGYCEYSFGGVVSEIAVVDYPWNRMHSYKTTIHEVMHGLLAQTKKDGKSLGVGLPKRFNEGLVELVGYTSCKEAYGKDFSKRNIRSYQMFTVDTFLRLRKLPEFKGKTLSQVGSEIGAMAFNRDYDGLDRVRSHLTSSIKDKKRLSDISNDVNKIVEAGEKRPGGLEGVAKRRYANLYDGSTAEYEKTEVAQLVELLKSGGMTMQQALASGRFMDAAIVLIYNILDEEDDEELGLF